MTNKNSIIQDVGLCNIGEMKDFIVSQYCMFSSMQSMDIGDYMYCNKYSQSWYALVGERYSLLPFPCLRFLPKIDCWA